MAIQTFTFVTVSQTIPFEKRFARVVITQEYNAEHEIGHYRGYIELYDLTAAAFVDNPNTVLSVFQTTGAPHNGKIDGKICHEEFEHWQRHL